MDLRSIAESIRSFSGATRKMPIAKVTERMIETVTSVIVPGTSVVASFGEDCAVLDFSDKERYILFKAEEMWHELVEADPKFAGYCSVLVSVNDVTVKGGVPMAIVDTLASKSIDTREQIVDGIVDGCSKFNVPIVGGHLNPDSPFNALSIAIIGIVNKNSLIRSDTAQIGDMVIAAVDLEGRFHKRFKFAWDTTTNKSKESVQERLMAIREIGRMRIATAAKDISNPGIIGTLGMLLDASDAGATIDLTNIPKPVDVDLAQWLKAYPGFGVVLTASSKKADECLSIFRNHGLEAAIVGKVDGSRKLLLTDRKSQVEVFDFRRDTLSGKPSIQER